MCVINVDRVVADAEQRSDLLFNGFDFLGAGGGDDVYSDRAIGTKAFIALF